jgi:hypothetical protein
VLVIEITGRQVAPLNAACLAEKQQLLTPLHGNGIGVVNVGVLASSAVDCGLEPG